MTLREIALEMMDIANAHTADYICGVRREHTYRRELEELAEFYGYPPEEIEEEMINIAEESAPNF